MLKASGTVLSEGEASVAADEDVRGRFRRRSVGRTLFLGLGRSELVRDRGRCSFASGAGRTRCAQTA
ncbi:hypothetical protein ACP3TJ_06040, partial [Desulforudis sp. 1088]|uniref:hypothetical protein n=1 Tax=Desulforudis sp. 1088 TaxID=3416137 RepID=UPI003CF72688